MSQSIRDLPMLTGEPIPPGFRSAEAKRRYTGRMIVATILYGVVMFGLTVGLPVGATFVALMRGISMAFDEIVYVRAGAVGDELLTIEDNWQAGQIEIRQAPLQNPADSQSTSAAIPTMGQVLDTVSDGSRWWLLVDDVLYRYERGAVQEEPPLPGTPLGDAVFLLDGAPAILVGAGEGDEYIYQLTSHGWRATGRTEVDDDNGVRSAAASMPAAPAGSPAMPPPVVTPGPTNMYGWIGSPVQVVQTTSGVHVFRLDDSLGQIEYHPGWPNNDGTAQWHTVAASSYLFNAMVRNDQPVLVWVSHGPGEQIRLAEIDASGQPSPLGAAPIPLGDAEAVQIISLPDQQVGVIAADVGGPAKLMTIRDGRLVSSRWMSGDWTLAAQMGLGIIVSLLGGIIVSLLYVLLAMFWGSNARDRLLPPSAGEAVALAGFGRRMLARGFDLGLCFLPLAVADVMLSLDAPETSLRGYLHAFVDTAGQSPWPWLLTFAGVVLVLVFGVIEGVTGRTPGKALFGLRTVRGDGKPVTVGAGLVRTLLLAVDGFSIFAPGLILMAFSARMRRLGDMAAGTLVVRPAP